MFMWLSSTQPQIALWGGEAGGGGKALRAGRPVAVVKAAAAAADGGADRTDAEENVDIFDVTPPYAEDATEAGGSGGGGGGLDDGACLLDAPVGMIRGQPGVVRHIILNNR